MKYFITLFLSFIIYTATAQTYELNINIENIQKVNGILEVAIYNKPETFLVKGEALNVYTYKVTKKSKFLTIKGLPKGEYAIAVYHDLNSDKQCNKNIFGLPSESYGFSTNFKPRISKPSFDDCKIIINNSKSINIALI